MAWTFAGQWGPEAIIDHRGNAQRGAKVYVYESGTQNLATLWESRDKNTEADNPVEVDSKGNLKLFADPGLYRAEVYRDGVKRFEFDVAVSGELALAEGEFLRGAGSGPALEAIDSGTFQRAVALDIRNKGAVADGAMSAVQATKDALAERDVVIITDGTYFFDGQVDVVGPKELHIADDATVLVQNGYSGIVFRLSMPEYDQDNGGAFKRARITGTGRIVEENVSPGRQRLWTGVQVFADGQGDTDHVTGGCVSPISILHPGVGLQLKVDNTAASNAFITGMEFAPFIDYPVVGVEFVKVNGGTINNNGFDKTLVQTRSGITTYAFKDVQGSYNRFIGCIPWDTTVTGAIAMNILSDALATLIVGGMSRDVIEDNGTDTLVVGPTGDRMTIRYPLTTVSSATPQVILLTKVNDGVGHRMYGTLRGHNSLTGFMPSLAFLHVTAGQNSADGRQSAHCVKHGELSDAITTRRLVECDYNGSRWLGIELSGTGSSVYPNVMDFVGVLVDTDVPKSVALADCSNVVAHTPDSALDGEAARITGSGEEYFAVTTDENGGQVTKVGDGSMTTFTIPHGLSGTPTMYGVQAESADALGEFRLNGADATNITIVYTTAPPSGTGNLTWNFDARL